MQQKRIIPFKVSGMDSLGQGVSKETNKITFIPKTLPGDEGTAEINSEKKGVAFAKAKTFSTHSDLRIEPDCPHFEICPSCHYQHTSYENELKFKKQNLERLFYKIPHPEIKVIGAVRRFEYRNRIQLHFDTKKKLLGMLDIGAGTIAPIPQCIIGLAPLQKEILRLYENQNWIKEVPSGVDVGHVEIYMVNDEIRVTWNRPYAEGGFTQVFQEMNEVLKVELNRWNDSKSPSDLLDLFAGNGNLTSHLNYSKRLCVDIYDKSPGNDFLSQHLYADEALSRVKKAVNSQGLKDFKLILDPPRSGMKDLKGWLDQFKPQNVAYVSCDPHTLARDVAALTDYTIESLLLLDFFPSTFHFETLIFLERKH